MIFANDLCPKANKLKLNMEKKNWKTWMARMGWAGFFFFLGKGLLWLALIFGLFKAC